MSMFLALLIVTMAPARTKTLQIYFIDVEGGQATLLVGPYHQSVLVDTGWSDFNGRDAERIVAAAHAAGVQSINYLVITHYHTDHVGGVTQLADRIKIGAFLDHGPVVETSEDTRTNFDAYEKAAAHAHRMTVSPGQGLPLRGMAVEVVTAAGRHLDSPLPGAGTANPFCVAQSEPPVDTGENAQSVGVLVSYGRFHFLDLGDLTMAKELALMCPNNLIGTADVFLVSHHGLNNANSKALVYALHPRVAILNNGAHKGGDPDAWQRVHDSPGLQDIWQLHYAVAGGEAHNAAGEMIANPEGQPDAGNYLKLTAEPNANFTVVNSRNDFQKTYGK